MQAALDLIKNEQVSAIIGPINSMQAEFMIRLANKSQVPTITFSATSPLLTSTSSEPLSTTHPMSMPLRPLLNTFDGEASLPFMQTTS
ncbi:unnamed protein product [Thlaspi arvense]|uniref:Receptor ligand binding region domain-containing protein n=1 Tax=Thlaspi arvense TaxID=13288 RepID=A0AAU9S8D9_THLAR|nr:unnamed protein product [Thlaspi arvense]